MNFMTEAAAGANKIWTRCVEGSFLTEMGQGTLDRQKFLDYIVQDSIYLRDYLKSYAMAIFKSRTIKEMQVCYSVLGFVNESENVTRLRYLQDNGMTDADVEGIAKQPECEAYTRFLIDLAKDEDLPEILMSVMPCMLGYYEVFKLVRNKYPQVLTSYYGDLVKDYTSDEYKECCGRWISFVNELCENLDDNRKARLKDIYLQASMHELYFWQMAGKNR